MKKVPWFWLSILLIFTIILFVSWQQFSKLTPAADFLTEKEAIDLVESRYQGQVSEIKMMDQQYNIELEKQNKLYTINLDAESGKVLKFSEAKATQPTPAPQNKDELTEEEIKKIILTQVNGAITSLEKKLDKQSPYYQAVVDSPDQQTTILVDAVSGNIISSESNKKNEPAKKLKESDAINIALKQVQGEVDNIWLESIDDQTYYLVEIETPDDQEAVIQIHAITGEVFSVTWDDRKHEEKEKEDDDD
nr:PepSY domain-containing protein [Neobacillus sp. Marseille-Q6967]